MKRYFSPPVQAFLGIVMILSAGIYWLSDYYLNSISKEMMLDWEKTEAVSIQEGNLLTSVTKSQPYLKSSNFVKGIQLFKLSNGYYEPRISMGTKFEPRPTVLARLGGVPTVSRVGFLHSQVYYRIPSDPNFVFAFDIQSEVLCFAFFGAVAVLVLLLIGLISVLRMVEAKELHNRERLLKLAINDLILTDAPTNLLNEQFPEFAVWWSERKKELAEVNRLANENNSKIVLGEMASRLAHDIKNSLRNIKTLVKRTTGLNESQSASLQNSFVKIEAIASTISERTQQILKGESNRKSIVDIMPIVAKVVAEKSSDDYPVICPFNQHVTIECYLNPLEFERSISSLVDNAIEASSPGAAVNVVINTSINGVEVSIIDSGRGISPSHLARVGIKGFTHGKATGTGLGAFYAKKFVIESGGQFSISSDVGKGTAVRINLPLIGELPPLPTEIRLKDGMSLAVLDDDPFVLGLVQEMLSSVEGGKIKYKLFQHSSELEAWANDNNEDFFLVSDFYLEGQAEDGLDVIERLDFTSKSWIFTSAPEDEKIRSKARLLGVPVIAKEDFYAMSASIVQDAVPST